MNFFKAVIGLLLIFLYHIPRLFYLLLLASYAFVFKNQEPLTADPNEHLRIAKKLLNKNKNSLLLYAALEIRFALERMTQRELIFAEKISKKALKEYDPVKKRKALSRVDKDADYPHKIYFINKKTGKKFGWGEYKPLNLKKVNQINGKLGNLLHPKNGLFLGISNDKWYQDTRNSLAESIEYLSNILEDNHPYFAYAHLDQFELVR